MFTRRDIGKLAVGAGAVTLATPLRHARAQSRPTLTIAVDNLWSNMAPINGLATTSGRIFPNFYDALIERNFLDDPNGLKLEPKLATEWEQNGNVWTITIREGVKFHNGAELTAEDVAFTLSSDRLWGPKPSSREAGPSRRVQARGGHGQEHRRNRDGRPDPNVPGKLTGNIGFVVPKKYYLEVGVDKFGQAPIGTGPYKVTTFRSGEVMVLDAFDEYWGGPPPAQRLVWRIVPEFAARLAGVVSGEFDLSSTSRPTRRPSSRATGM
jgi:peptide/nickel transport system substrate-binding protein